MRPRPLNACAARPAEVPRLSLLSVRIVICCRRRWGRPLVVRATHDCPVQLVLKPQAHAIRSAAEPCDEGVAGVAATPRIRS